jgi:hypothetical protein
LLIGKSWRMSKETGRSPTTDMPSDRTDESIGAVPLDGLNGVDRANAMMKAETKAKRRVTLAICGLSVLDETEVETVRGATVAQVDHSTGAIVSGTKEAAQAVCQAKLAEINQRRALPPADGTVTYEPIKEEPSLEHQLRESIKQVDARNARRGKSKGRADRSQLLEAFKSLAQRYRAIGMAARYCEVLGYYHVEDVDEFSDTEQGSVEARTCYRVMSLDVADAEVFVAQQREQGINAEA